MAPRFFHPEPLSVGARAELSPTAATHARTVLRLRAGAEITLIGRGRGEEEKTPGGIQNALKKGHKN